MLLLLIITLVLLASTRAEDDKIVEWSHIKVKIGKRQILSMDHGTLHAGRVVGILGT